MILRQKPRMSSPRKAAFIFVFITVALDMLAIGIIIPVLPKLIAGFLAGDTARAALKIRPAKFPVNLAGPPWHLVC